MVLNVAIALTTKLLARMCGSPQVEIEHHSVAQFDHVTAFEAL